MLTDKEALRLKLTPVDDGSEVTSFAVTEIQPCTGLIETPSPISDGSCEHTRKEDGDECKAKPQTREPIENTLAIGPLEEKNQNPIKQSFASNSKILFLRILATLIDAVVVGTVVAFLWSCFFNAQPFSVGQPFYFSLNLNLDRPTLDSFCCTDSCIGLQVDAFRALLLIILAAFSCLVPLYPLGWQSNPLDIDAFARTAPNWVTYLLALLPLVVNAIYCVSFESSRWQGTIGKHLLGLKVGDLTGRRIGLKTSAARFLAKQLTQATLGVALVGFLLPARRCLHDLISRTTVSVTHSGKNQDAQSEKMPLRSKLTLVTISLLVLSLLGQCFYDRFVEASTMQLKIKSLEKSGNKRELIKTLGELAKVYERNQQLDQSLLALAKLKNVCQSVYPPNDAHAAVVLKASELAALQLHHFSQAAQFQTELNALSRTFTKAPDERDWALSSTCSDFGWDQNSFAHYFRHGYPQVEDGNIEIERIWLAAAEQAREQRKPEEVEYYCKKLIEQAKLSVKEFYSLHPSPPAKQILYKEALKARILETIKQANVFSNDVDMQVRDVNGGSVSLGLCKPDVRNDLENKMQAILSARAVLKVMPQVTLLRFYFSSKRDGPLGSEGPAPREVDLTAAQMVAFRNGKIMPSSISALDWTIAPVETTRSDSATYSDDGTESQYWVDAYFGCCLLAESGEYSKAAKLFDDLIASSKGCDSWCSLIEVPKMTESGFRLPVPYKWLTDYVSD